MKPSAKSLVLDLLSTLRRGSMPVGALVAAARCFGIGENNVRVTLARLYSAGTIERDERGRYRLGEPTRAVRQRVTSWRDAHERLGAWCGAWIGVHSGALPRPRGRALEPQRRALRFLGFRSLGEGLELRPDNLVGGVAAVRDQLLELGLAGEAPVFGLSDLDPATELRARSLWDAAELSAGYASARRELEASAERLRELPREQAMVESFLLGGRVLRQIVLDPLLPEPLVSAEARQGLVETMREYDRLGRECWSTFLQEYDVVQPHTPVDLRVSEAARAVAFETPSPGGSR